MLKVLETKSERIELELKADPTRSDREIGRICGVDGKTVRAHQAKITELALEIPHHCKIPHQIPQLGKLRRKIPHWTTEIPHQTIRR